MKNLILGLFTFLSVGLFAQSNLSVAVKYQVVGSPSIAGNSYTINGVVTDDNGLWNATTIALGDSIFYLEGGVIYSLVVTTINSASGTTLNVTALSVPPLISSAVSGNLSGQVVISRKGSNGLCAVPANLASLLASALENRNKQKTVSAYTAAGGITIVGSVIKSDTTILATKTDTAQLNSKSLTLAQLANKKDVVTYVSDTTGNYVKYRLNLIGDTTNLESKALFLAQNAYNVKYTDTTAMGNGFIARTPKFDSTLVQSKSLTLAQLAYYKTIATYVLDTATFNSKSLTLAQLASKLGIADTTNNYKVLTRTMGNTLYAAGVDTSTIYKVITRTMANSLYKDLISYASDTAGNYVKYRANLVTYVDSTNFESKSLALAQLATKLNVTDSITFRTYSNVLYQNKAAYLTDTTTFESKSLALAQLAAKKDISSYVSDTTGNYVKYRLNLLSDSSLLQSKSLTLAQLAYYKTNASFVIDSATFNSKSLTLAQLALKTNLSDTVKFVNKSTYLIDTTTFESKSLALAQLATKLSSVNSLGANLFSDTLVTQQFFSGNYIFQKTALSDVSNRQRTNKAFLGSLTAAAGATTTIVIPITYSPTTTVPTTTDVSQIELWYQPSGTFNSYSLIPLKHFTLTSWVGGNITILLGSAPVAGDVFNLRVK